jgi:hypothetical protein
MVMAGRSSGKTSHSSSPGPAVGRCRSVASAWDTLKLRERPMRRYGAARKKKWQVAYGEQNLSVPGYNCGERRWVRSRDALRVSMAWEMEENMPMRRRSAEDGD